MSNLIPFGLELIDDGELVWPGSGALDIACMKLVAVGRRGARRDFGDIYFALRDVAGLDELLSAVGRKYAGTTYNVEHVPKSLVYFEDAEDEPLPKMLVDFSWEEAKESLRGSVRKRLERKLGL